MALEVPVRKLMWVNIIFFSVITLVTLIAGPIYIYHHGISAWEWVLFLFFSAVTGLSITVGYHRLYAHATFKAHPIVHFFVLLFGAASFEQTALCWASQHRDHHRYVDTDLDPYSIKKGFFYAHLGWMIFWKHGVNYDNAKDLQKNKMLMNQMKYYGIWSIGAGIVLPVLLGALSGHALGAFIIAVCMRLVFVYNATFCINSVCHMFGKPTYDIYSTAKDHWFVALLTNGEGYHNFHHRFPTDYRNGVRWYHWDPSKWLIWSLSRLGLASDLKRVSKFQILQARFEGERQLLHDQYSSVKEIQQTPWREKASHLLNEKHAQLAHTLAEWEKHAKEYRASMLEKTATRSEEWKAMAQKNMAEARQRFMAARREWAFLIRNSSIPSF